MKEYIFNYINMEFPEIKTYAKNWKIRLSNDDKRKCLWILFKDVNLELIIVKCIIIKCFIIWMIMRRRIFLWNI